MKNIEFPFLTNFTGRNGYGKCSGLEILQDIDREGGRCIMLTPLTSKGSPANCDVLIPVASIDNLVAQLLQIKNKGLNANVCPHCGSENINAGHFDPEGCFCPVECEDCGKEWQDVYVYAGIEIPVSE